MIRYVCYIILLFASTAPMTVWGCAIGYSLTDRIHGRTPYGSTLVYIQVQLGCG